MNPIVKSHLAELDALCRRHHVKRLELFGSAATGDFRHECSDIDFLVEFEPEHSARAFDYYFDLLENLERLFGRKIDLVCVNAVRNPYFLREVNKTRQLLYAA